MKARTLLTLLLGLSVSATLCTGCSQVSSPVSSDGQADITSAVKITLGGDSISVDGNGTETDGATVTITEAGSYQISGTLNDGQILIDAGKEDEVTLILDGASITCSDSAGIYAKQAGLTTLYLNEGTQNTVTDGTDYTYPDGGDEPDAAIFAKDDLTIAGSGTLVVNGNFHNGIGSKDNLTIESGTLEITAVNDALRGRDSVTIHDGSFVIDAQGDGIKSNNDEDPEKGWILISAGNFHITAGNDAVQAETSLQVTGGDFDLVTGGGSANAPTRTADIPGAHFGGGRQPRPDGITRPDGSAPSDGTTPPDDAAAPGTMTPPDGATPPENMASPEAAGSSDAETPPTPAASPADLAAATTESGTSDSTEDTSDSYKGLKAGTELAISGGTFSVDSADDAVHSNGTLTVGGGNFVISTGDDAFHADGALTIEDGDILIETCYEGLEGVTVDMTGGTVQLTATDDGVNAAGGSDGETGGFGMDRFQNIENHHICISGGTLLVDASGDGLDSNGTLTIDGGLVVVNGPSSGADTALDSDGECSINGGIVVAAGASGGIPQSFGEGTQNALMVYFTENQPAGTLISLTDSSGNAILTAAPEKDFQTLILSAPELTMSETYTLYTGGSCEGSSEAGYYGAVPSSGGTKLIDVTLASAFTRISSDGSEVTETMGRGMGGGPGGGRGQRMHTDVSGEAQPPV